MHFLDIISDSPSAYIFQKSSNKKNLGGIFTLIYLIILLFIIVTYLFDYYTYEKYEYNEFYKYFLNEKQREEKRNDEHYNSPIGFSFEIQNYDGKIVDNNDFHLYLYKKNNEFEKEVEIGEKIYKKPGEFMIYGIYNCLTSNCEFNIPKDKDNFPFDIIWPLPLKFKIIYDTIVIDFENPDSPINKLNGTFMSEFFVEQGSYINLNWNVYNYEEKKGIFSRVFDTFLNKQNNITYGDLSNINSGINLVNNSIQYNKETGNIQKIAFILNIENPFDKIHYFKRKKISILDYFANIAALGITIFNMITKIFGFLYSKTFDNYKIIENLLNKESEMIKKIELKNDNKLNSDSEDNLINNNIEDINEDNIKLSNVKDNLNNDRFSINNCNPYSIDEIDKAVTKLPKLRFYDFIFNNIYCKCCTFIKKQKLIDSCDDILYRYYQ